MKKGILLCGHGSRTKTGTDSFKELVDLRENKHVLGKCIPTDQHPI